MPSKDDLLHLTETAEAPKKKDKSKDKKKTKGDKSHRAIKSERRRSPEDPDAPAASGSARLRLFQKREDKNFASDEAIRNIFQKNADKVNFSAFETKRIIGCGSFGMVSLVVFGKKKSFNGCRLPPFCLKSVDKGRIVGQEQITHVTNEYTILRMMENHPNVVQLYGVFHDRKYVHYITEYIPGGELFQRIYPTASPSKNLGLPIDVARFYFSEVLSVFEFMHERNIVYRDLKPENILIAASGHIKLVDFGFAKDLRTCPNNRTSTICGTMEYLSPEMAQAHLITAKGNPTKRPIPQHAIGVDQWALGIFLFELVNARSPFSEHAENPIEMCKHILRVKFQWPEGMDPACKDLIKRCLRREPHNRIGGHNHPMHLHEFIMQDSNKNLINWDDVKENKLTPPWKPRLQGSLDTSRFKQPIPEEIKSFGAVDPNNDLQGEYSKFFGPMQKHQPPVFTQPTEKR